MNELTNKFQWILKAIFVHPYNLYFVLCKKLTEFEGIEVNVKVIDGRRKLVPLKKLTAKQKLLVWLVNLPLTFLMLGTLMVYYFLLFIPPLFVFGSLTGAMYHDPLNDTITSIGYYWTLGLLILFLGAYWKAIGMVAGILSLIILFIVGFIWLSSNSLHISSMDIVIILLLVIAYGVWQKN